MKDKQSIPSVLHRTIPQDEAVSRTTQWRALYKDTMHCEDPDILRGYFIPIEDILAIYEFYKTSGVPLLGVRGYMGNNGLVPIAPQQYNLDMLLVPVGLDNKDILQAPPKLVAAGLGDGSSTIYDFTAPCPTNCDTTSALYSVVQVVK